MLHSLINRARAKVHNARAGFTLIELLVVIVLIGILMAIAVPTFQNAQQRGQATSAQTELETAFSIAQSEFSYNADGTYPSTATLVAKMEESEDDTQFSTLALDSVTVGPNNGLYVLEDAVISSTTSPTPQDVLSNDSFEPVFENFVTSGAGTVGVQVFDFSGASAGRATQTDGDDAVTLSGTNPGAGGSLSAPNVNNTSLVLARQDVSRNTVVWWLVSNRDEALPDDYVGTFYGSDRNSFTWRGND